jgi:hypothetical protein
MAFTFQQVADRARIPLNDSDKVRYPDSELLTHAVDAYLLLRRYRPDLFITSYTALPDFNTLTLTSPFPGADDHLLPAVADYVTARAEFKDDEHVLKERAQLFYQLFSAGTRAP